MSPEMVAQLKQLNLLLNDAPNLFVLVLLIAVTPAICEELAFRGFILSGLRHSGHRWGAIVVSAIFFGIAHMILQQSILTAAVGVVIGYLAVKTGSLLPGVLFHAVFNGLSVVVPALAKSYGPQQPWIAQLFRSSPEESSYTWPVIVASGVLTAGLLWWFKSLPYQATEEEALHEALDNESLHDPPAEPVKAVA